MRKDDWPRDMSLLTVKKIVVFLRLFLTRTTLNGRHIRTALCETEQRFFQRKPNFGRLQAGAPKTQSDFERIAGILSCGVLVKVKENTPRRMELHED